LKKTKNRNISKEEIEHIAELAHIQLNEKEKEVFTDQFNDILDFFNEIDKVNTEGVPPTHHTLPVSNIYREDKITPSLSKEDALSNAPKKERGYFKAPRII
jgi:aspartyl-tRNA(Asn)/glutamyl-tRNA(Gln) amidotransferase subunit C